MRWPWLTVGCSAMDKKIQEHFLFLRYCSNFWKKWRTFQQVAKRCSLVTWCRAEQVLNFIFHFQQAQIKQIIFLGFEQLHPHYLWLKQFLSISSVVSSCLAHCPEFCKNTNSEKIALTSTVCSWFCTNNFLCTSLVLSFSLAKFHIFCKEFTLPQHAATCQMVFPSLPRLIKNYLQHPLTDFI